MTFFVRLVYTIKVTGCAHSVIWECFSHLSFPNQTANHAGSSLSLRSQEEISPARSFLCFFVVHIKSHFGVNETNEKKRSFAISFRFLVDFSFGSLYERFLLASFFS